MVRIHPDPPEQGTGARQQGPGRGGTQNGAVAQLGERLLCKQEAVGSIPSSSTSQAAGARGPQGMAGSGGNRIWQYQDRAAPIDCSVEQRSTLAIEASRQR